MQENENNNVPFPFQSSEGAQNPVNKDEQLKNIEELKENTDNSLIINESSEQDDNFVWNVVSEGKKLGPFTTQEIINSLRAKVFDPDSLAWRSGLDDWFRLKDFAEFRKVLREIAPDDLSINESSILKEQLLCPNCFAKLPVSAQICPACDLKLKISELKFNKKIQEKEPWHFRISVIAGFLMLTGIIFPWINLGQAGSLNGSSVPGSFAFILLAVIATALSIQNFRTKPKRNLSIWLIAAAALILSVNLSINLISNKTHIVETVQQETGYVFDKSLNNTEDKTASDVKINTSKFALISSGLILYMFGALLILLAISLPTCYRVIEKPIGAIFLIIFAVLIFVGYIQLLNGSGYKHLFRMQLEIQGYEVSAIKRTNKPTNIFNNFAEVEVFATKSSQHNDSEGNDKSKIKTEYYYCKKCIELGSLDGLKQIDLKQIDEKDLSLFKEFNNNAESHDKN